MIRNLIPGVLLLLLPACDLVSGVTEERHMGAIGFPDDLAIVMPDTVAAGADFTAEVRTRGADGCWRRDRTDVTIDALTATVTPWDVDRTSRGTNCTQMVVEIMHTATLSFAQPGVARVEIRGRDGTAVRSVVVEPS